MERSSGILLPVASLPSKYGIGCFDESAYHFVDCLAKAGQSYWQILPMGPTGYGDSPYQAFSTFAGNPYFISLAELVKKGYITEAECQKAAVGTDEKYIRYDVLYKQRYAVLRKAFTASGIESSPEYNEFVQKNQDWLPDYALFMAIKDSKGGKSYMEWEEDIRLRRSKAMVYYKNRLIDEVHFYQFLQFEFARQWQALKKYANEKGISIIGDIPIYVALDSADTWSHPELFQFDDKGEPIGVAGCPPDAFSETGQLWGNPLYRWEAHRESGYSWWLARLRNCCEWYDMVRIDHFRGFDEYYAIPYGDSTAENGKWEAGPGMELFETLKRELGEMPIIAEDLGFLTDSVRQLLQDCGFPGMKVLQFAFDSREDSDYLPYRYVENSVVYTGTHDNATTYGWWSELTPEDKEVALRYMNRSRRTPKKTLTWDMICLAMASVSALCIVPMQDYLCLSNKARINTPSTLGCNWQWRMSPKAWNDALCQKVYGMTRLYGRLSTSE